MRLIALWIIIYYGLGTKEVQKSRDLKIGKVPGQWKPYYSPVHQCWPKTLVGCKQGKSSKFRPILATQEPLTAFHRIMQKKFFFEKKVQNGHFKKTPFSKPSILNIFFAKLSGIGPWVSRIN